jgi:hypothetical protein
MSKIRVIKRDSIRPEESDIIARHTRELTSADVCCIRDKWLREHREEVTRSAREDRAKFYGREVQAI